MPEAPAATTKNYKTRSNYATGGWCPKRSKCANDGEYCDFCFEYSDYKKKEKNGNS